MSRYGPNLVPNFGDSRCRGGADPGNVGWLFSIISSAVAGSVGGRVGELSGRPEIDGQLESSRKLDAKPAWLFSLQDFIHESGCSSVIVADLARGDS